MKTAIIIADGLKQIMFTPENDSEKEALSLITPSDDINIEIKEGSFMDEVGVQGYKLDMCRGGYLRAWTNNDSVMLVLTPKKKSKS